MQAYARWARAGLLVIAAGGGWAGLIAACMPVLARGASTGFDQPAVAAAAVTSVTATWLLGLLFAELVDALGPSSCRAARGAGLPARAGVAALVAFSLGTPAAAVATDEPLPLPDRAESTLGAVTTRPAAQAQVLVVQPGDSLWRLAAAHLADRPDDVAAVHRVVVRLHDANRAVIGADPDHILPGTRLRVPSPHREEHP